MAVNVKYVCLVIKIRKNYPHLKITSLHFVSKLLILNEVSHFSLMPKCGIQLPTVKPFLNFILPDGNHLISL